MLFVSIKYREMPFWQCGPYVAWFVVWQAVKHQNLPRHGHVFFYINALFFHKSIKQYFYVYPCSFTLHDVLLYS